jgi:hypothetical protein
MIHRKPFALLALLPALVLGQGPAAPTSPAKGTMSTQPKKAAATPAGDSTGAADEGEPELLAPEGSAEAVPQTGSVPPPDSYTVRSGDTLWDLSGRFLNNPWYWPKVWSYNPEINNPHWISPGSVLRFFPSSEEAPTRVEPVEAEEEVSAPRELEDLSKGSINKIEQLGEEDAVAVVGPYKVGYTPPKSANLRRDSFVTERELEESGAITAAFEEKLLLWTTDRAYVTFRGPAPVKVGQAYAIYRTDGPVVHPVTHELFGYKSTIIGTVSVVAVDDKAATVVITRAFDPIERGHFVAPWSDKLLKRVPRRPNQRAMNGVILTAQTDMVTQFGEHHVVFVDKGRTDGVEEGNTFSVIRSGDPYGQPPASPQNDPTLPTEVIGDLLVIDAKDHASAALVSRSLRELYVGDLVEMRPGSGKGPVKP